MAIVLLLAVAGIGAVRGGQYRAFVESEGGVGDFLARVAGLGVKAITMTGQSRLAPADVLRIAGVSPKSSMPFFDVEAAREGLEKTPLVKRASVRKLYPGQIVKDLVERAPAALWQSAGEVKTIAADGAVIDELRDVSFADLPFVVGDGANERLPEFAALLDKCEELRPKVVAGVLVDGRRWNLRLRSGMDVKLPEVRAERGDSRTFEIAARVAHPGSRRALGRSAHARQGVRAPVGRRTRRPSGSAAEERRGAMMFKPLTPRMKAIPPRRSAVLSVVDVGASKVVCLIARLTPMERADTLRGRTHRCKVLGLGHQRSRGVKAGAIVDLEAAEGAIRLAIDAAERMAGAEVQSVIVNMSGGRLSSQLLAAKIAVRGKPVSDYEVHRVIEATSAASAQPGRAVLHAIATGFRLDAQQGVRDPAAWSATSSAPSSPSLRATRRLRAT